MLAVVALRSDDRPAGWREVAIGNNYTDMSANHRNCTLNGQDAHVIPARNGEPTHDCYAVPINFMPAVCIRCTFVK